MSGFYWFVIGYTLGAATIGLVTVWTVAQWEARKDGRVTPGEESGP